MVAPRADDPSSVVAPRAGNPQMGLLSTCAVCGAAATKNCPRCKTIYCSVHCQQEHWASGHKKKCKKIQRAGGAEQYHADKKAKEAADEAVAACAAQGVPQDAECFICGCSINSVPRSSEGIVSGCACRGTMGLAHLSCRVRQAEMEVKREEEWNDGEGFKKWHTCFNCGQHFHGAVSLALGWAGWKTYVGRPEADGRRYQALEALSIALSQWSHPEEALPVLEANLASTSRHWSHSGERWLNAHTILANCFSNVGRNDEALVLHRAIYAKIVATLGVSHEHAIQSGANLAISLFKEELFKEGKSLMCDELLPAARRSLGTDHDFTLILNQNLAAALADNPECTRDDLRVNQPGAASTRPFQPRRRPAQSRDHHRERASEAAPGLRSYASEDAKKRGLFVRRARKTRPRVDSA